MQLLQRPPEADSTATGPEPATKGASGAGRATGSPRQIRRRWKILFAILGVLTVGLALLPGIISHTNLSNAMLSHSLNDGDTATAESFSIGWFSPLIAHGVQIKKADQDKPVKVEKLEVGKSLFDIVRGKLKDATVTLTKPHFRIVLGDGGKSAGALFPRMKTKVVDGRLTVTQAGSKDAVLELDKLNFVTDVATIKDGRRMSITSSTILDRYKLTPELTDHGLGPIAPMLANAADIDGAISLHIESLKMRRVGEQSTVEKLRGTVTLHDATSSAGPVVSDLVDIMGYIVRRKIPKRLTVTRDSTVKFELRKDRFYHEGFAFVLPEISESIEVRSAGSVGLDESLDIQLSLVVPESLAATIPLLKPFIGKPVEVNVTGTLDEPIVGLPNDQRIAEYVASRLVPTPDGNPEALPAAIIRLVDGVADPARHPQDRVQTLPGTVLNLIRSVREKRRQQAESGELPRRRPRNRRRRGRDGPE